MQSCSNFTFLFTFLEPLDSFLWPEIAISTRLEKGRAGTKENCLIGPGISFFCICIFNNRLFNDMKMKCLLIETNLVM